MNQILVIDSCDFTQELLATGLSANGYEVIQATNGSSGFQLAIEKVPDIIVLSLSIKDVDCIEMVRAMRSEPRLEKTPVIALDETKKINLLAFAVGCDDVVGKPFSFDELSARVNSFLRRQRPSTSAEEKVQGAKWIAVHSLQGGVGCTSIAVNAALILNRLWGARTLLVDAAPSGGLMAQHFNRRPSMSWGELNEFDDSQIDRSIAKSIVDRGPSGLDFIYSPSKPQGDLHGWMRKIKIVLEELSDSYEYIVVDGISSLDTDAVSMISRADSTLIVSRPELYSLVNASTSINSLVDSGISPDKLEVTISHASWSFGMSTGVVEQAFDQPVLNWIRYAPVEFQRATNAGEPVAMAKKYSSVTRDLEDLVLRLSKKEHLMLPPAAPSCTWQRLKQRWGTFPDPKSSVVRQEAKRAKRWLF